MPNILYTESKKELLSGELSLSGDVLQLMLVTGDYTPDAADDFVDMGPTGNDPAGHEISVSGYGPGYNGSGRRTLQSKSFNTAGTTGEFHADPITWTALGIGATIRWVVLYRRGDSDAESRLVACYDLATPLPTNGSDLTISFSSSGALVVA